MSSGFNTNQEVLLNRILQTLLHPPASGGAATEATLQAILAKDTLIEVDTDAINLSVDGLEALQATSNTNTGNSATSLAIMDDWDESDRAKVNLIVGQAGIAAGTGVDGVTVPRVTLATNVGLPAGSAILGKTGIDQTTLGSTNGVSLVTHATSNGAPTAFRSLVVDTDEVQVKAATGNLYGWNIINLHSATIYVKFYNINGAINPAVDVPVLTLPIPSNSAVYQEPNCIQHHFTTAIAVRAVTGSGDTDATDPTTLPIIELKYV